MTPTTTPIGTHVLVGKGLVAGALADAARLGCEAIQVFTGNPRGWALTPGKPAEDAAFRVAAAEQGVRTFIDRAYVLPQLPQADMIPAVEGYAEFVRRLVKMNRDLTVKWAEAAGALTGAVRKQVPGELASDLVGDQATGADAEPPS